MTRTVKKNLWPFGSSREKSKPAKRSSMTISSATRAAFKAGQDSGDTDQFQQWAESKGLEGRGSHLRTAYEAGVTGDVGENSPLWLRAAAGYKLPKTSSPALTYKGYRIFQDGEGWRSSIDRGETLFDDSSEAKRFIDDEVKMRRNPRSKANSKRRRNSAEGSDAMYQSFHGKEPDGEVMVEETEHVHNNLAVIGALIQIRVDCVTGMRATLDFEDDPPFLCTNEGGTQLYIEAGNQSLDLEALGFTDSEWIKDRMVIGKFSPPAGKDEQWNIGYQTEKDFDDFETILYQHDLGEETAINGKAKKVAEDQRVRPMLEYDPINEKLFITGGKYIIKQPLFETSPGIEN